MPYLLDANACIEFLRHPDSAVVRRLAALRPEEIFLCDIVKAELYYGAYRSARPKDNLLRVEAFCVPFVSLSFDGVAAAICGRVRAELAAAGTPIGPYDLMIAAIALANDLILVTHNTREFSRIADLQIED
jgi:tRNA(fMet)-specific endonuclease VapC